MRAEVGMMIKSEMVCGVSSVMIAVEVVSILLPLIKVVTVRWSAPGSVVGGENKSSIENYKD